jgi:hypothetical protein
MMMEDFENSPSSLLILFMSEEYEWMRSDVTILHFCMSYFQRLNNAFAI